MAVWDSTKNWLLGTTVPEKPVVPAAVYQRKNTEIPVLQNYMEDPGPDFWKVFPSKKIDSAPVPRINVAAFREVIESAKHGMTCHEQNRAEKVCQGLEHGAETYLVKELPSIRAPNCKSALDNGVMMTDKICTWVKKGFVSGPFEAPPLDNFRVNPLMAIERKNSVRPVINMSAPKGNSFNEAVKKNKMEKVNMSTAQSFSYTLLEAGKNAVMSKFDYQDAYKNICTKICDLAKKGFYWMGRYFIEDKAMFGEVPAVCNFDALSNTTQTVARVVSDTDRKWCHRILDDLTIVAPEGSGICERFSAALEEICEKTNMLLAEECPRNEKAFKNKTEGVVMGIHFDTVQLQWSLTKDKADDLQLRIWKILESESCSLRDMQEVMGSVNYFCQMCPLMSAYRTPSNSFVRDFGGAYTIQKKIPAQVKKDLEVMLRASESARSGLPIAHKIGGVPLQYLVFLSDAAGHADKLDHDLAAGKGAASLGYDRNEKFWYCSRVRWPTDLLTTMVDSKGVRFGNKMTTLEAVGLLLPFVTVPRILAGRHVVLEVDNTSVVYGMRKKGTTGDLEAAILFRAIHVIASFLGVICHVRHVRRESTKASRVADRLSREATATKEVLLHISEAEQWEAPEVLTDWLECPKEDWSLVNKLLNYVESIV